MAEAFCRELGHGVECVSTGTHPEKEVAPDAVTAMKEVGIDISQARPKRFNDLPDRRFDYLATMGCEVVCPFLPGAEEVRWDIPDPHGKGVEEYRRVRNLIRQKVTDLLAELGRMAPTPHNNHQPLA
jgi:arsenate reductase